MKTPIDKKVIDELLDSMGIEDVSRTTIRQCVAVTSALEQIGGEPFIRLEIGVPGIPACQIGIDAQKQALDKGVSAIYPIISGLPELKQNASRFIKAFVDLDIDPECIVPTVGSMQGAFTLILECSQLQPEKDTILYINPGFAPHVMMSQVQNIRHEAFDVYEFRGKKLRAKLESYMSSGRIAAVVYSNPNNPSWICLTDEELQIIGELCTRYDVIALEDMAYMCMDFRTDKSHPFEPPFQPTIARYTDNYIITTSGSKIFSYAGERIAVVAFSPKLFRREYPELYRRYGLRRMGDNFVLTYLYVASSGTSHSAQYALSEMMRAAVDGDYDFVNVLTEYGDRATESKRIFLKHGFNIVYDKDNDLDVADGFFYTIGYKGMGNRELLTDLLRCGVSAITLNTTGSSQPGIRACVSRLMSAADFERLDENLALFVKLQNNEIS